MGIECGRQAQVRLRIHEREGHTLAFSDGEFADRAHVLAGESDGRAHHAEIGTGDRADAVVVGKTADPGNGRTVIEAQHQFHLHLHGAAPADHDPHEVGHTVADRHEVDERHSAFGRFEVRFEDQRIAAIPPRDHRRLGAVGQLGGDQPAAVFGRAQQRGETRAAIEARPAQPVYPALF